MNKQPLDFRKKREPGEIFSDSFQFIRQEFKPLSRLIAIYVLPFLVLYGYIQVHIQKNVMGTLNLTDMESLLANAGPFYRQVFLSSLFALFVQSLLAGTVYTYLDAYIKKGKDNFTLEEITSQLFSNSLIAIGANFVVFVIIVIGLFFCFVPGIYMANTLSIVVFIAILERKGVNHSLAKSWKLVNSGWWNTFFINVVGLLISWIAGVLVTLPLGIAGGVNALEGAAENAETLPEWYWVFIGLSSVVSSLLWIFLYTFLAFQYFNLEERGKPDLPTL